MLDPEWPEPLPPAAAYGSRAAKRLAKAAALRDGLAAPARQIARERGMLLFHRRICKAVREGLAALGFDPVLSTVLARVEIETAAKLAALPPAENDPPEPKRPRRGADSDEGVDRFRKQVRRFADPEVPPPDLAKELLFTLWAFVLARSPRHGLMPFGQEEVDAYEAALIEDEAEPAAANEIPDDAIARE